MGARPLPGDPVASVRDLLAAATLAFAAIVAACGWIAPSASASASVIRAACPPGNESGVVPESEAAAQVDAASLLAELRLPAGSSESASEPTEDGSLLARPGEGPPATPNAVDEHASWLAPGGPPEALEYVCTHLPAGTISTTICEDCYTGPNIPENAIAAFAVPENRGTLVIWAVRLPDGSTALRADAQVVWRTPRPASERLPSGARLMRIAIEDASARAGEPEPELLALLPREVTSVAEIEAVVALLNGLGLAQPGLTECPDDLGARNVELSFYASPDAAPLGVADIMPGGCGGVRLTLGGVSEPSLEGGWKLIEAIGKALMVNAAPRPPAGAPPLLSRVRMSRARFGANAHGIVTPGVKPGTSFLFYLSAPAGVSVSISRLPPGVRYAGTCAAKADRPRRARGTHCRRTTVLDTFTRPREPDGEDGITFSGAYGRRRLAPGRYFAVLRARNTDGSSPPVSVEFEITR